MEEVVRRCKRLGMDIIVMIDGKRFMGGERVIKCYERKSLFVRVVCFGGFPVHKEFKSVEMNYRST